MGGHYLRDLRQEGVCVFLDARGASRAKKVAKRSPKVLQKSQKKRKSSRIPRKNCIFCKNLVLAFWFVSATTFRVIFQKPQLLPSTIALNRILKCSQIVSKRLEKKRKKDTKSLRSKKAKFYKTAHKKAGGASRVAHRISIFR